LGTGAIGFFGPATLDLNGYGTTAASLFGFGGTITNGGNQASVLTLAGAAGGNFSGTIEDGANGTIALIKNGSARNG
jgi:hypothetical protein